MSLSRRKRNILFGLVDDCGLIPKRTETPNRHIPSFPFPKQIIKKKFFPPPAPIAIGRRLPYPKTFAGKSQVAFQLLLNLFLRRSKLRYWGRRCEEVFFFLPRTRTLGCRNMPLNIRIPFYSIIFHWFSYSDKKIDIFHNLVDRIPPIATHIVCRHHGRVGATSGAICTKNNRNYSSSSGNVGRREYSPKERVGKRTTLLSLSPSLLRPILSLRRVFQSRRVFVFVDKFGLFVIRLWKVCDNPTSFFRQITLVE